VSVPDRLVVLVPALAAVAIAMFAGYTAAQLGVGEVALADRGAASAFYFSAYYASGALGAFAPGLAWERWGWTGVVVCDALALAIALLALLALAGHGRRGLDGARTAPYPPGL
jgi:YNFM family putative membrane transporter